MRASNVQREQAVEELNRALGEGRVSLAEFEQRSAAASFTVWADQLATFTADLPGRATYEQRAHVVERLGEAAAQGYLQFPEFEERAVAVNQTVWAADLSRFAVDLPPAFRTVPQLAATAPAVLHKLSGFGAVKIAQRNPAKTAAFAAILVVIAGAGVVAWGARSKPGEPSAAVEAVAAATATAEYTPHPAIPAATTRIPTKKATATQIPTTTVATPEITIECNVGRSDDKVTYTSLEDAWAENSGTYFCEAQVPDSHRLTGAEKKAVVIDQRIGNGDSIIDSLGVLLSFCADTVKYEVTDEETRPATVRDFEQFGDERLAAMYQLCPAAPTAKLMREVIYSR
ncbi:hypothetical protein ADL15_03955 [Actinoplanes awajinensis subsp. mycoplanecinus]|uniref:DUF1707 domain-containing protein n=1 Tax=Actinoplanes awajinensis subsp. mycoplanecinus TaxID=135947 RepID=A0A0X3V9D0_9ACTN|nr:hypothetical protein ADL15_03955 [Actinoplanes awajinensis subsp. mycoplanecinus]